MEVGEGVGEGEVCGEGVGGSMGGGEGVDGGEGVWRSMGGGEGIGEGDDGGVEELCDSVLLSMRRSLLSSRSLSCKRWLLARFATR